MMRDQLYVYNPHKASYQYDHWSVTLDSLTRWSANAESGETNITRYDIILDQRISDSVTLCTAQC